MMSELHARNSDPSTSHSAMKRIAGNQKKIMDALYDFGNRGATCNQLADAMGMPRDSISPNMPKLEEAHHVERSGYKRGSEQVWLHHHHARIFIPFPDDNKMEAIKRPKTKKQLQTELAALKRAYFGNMRLLSDNIENKSISSGTPAHILVDCARVYLSRFMKEEGIKGYEY